MSYAWGFHCFLIIPDFADTCIGGKSLSLSHLIHFDDISIIGKIRAWQWEDWVQKNGLPLIPDIPDNTKF